MDHGSGADGHLAAGLDGALVELMGRVAHDLNNHLATIIGKAEIGRMFDDPERWKRSVDESFEAGQGARVLVADVQRLLGWLRSQADDPVSAHDVLSIVASLTTRQLERGGVELVRGDVAPLVVSRPAESALLCWLLVGELLDRGPKAERWTLSALPHASGGWSLSLAHPGAAWSADDPARLERGVRSFPPIGAPGRRLLVAGPLLAGLGGRARLELDSFSLLLPS